MLYEPGPTLSPAVEAAYRAIMREACNEYAYQLSRPRTSPNQISGAHIAPLFADAALDFSTPAQLRAALAERGLPKGDTSRYFDERRAIVDSVTVLLSPRSPWLPKLLDAFGVTITEGELK
jgi:hypothetical protein